MVRYCEECNKTFGCEAKKCPDCGAKLKKRYTQQELDAIEKENDDITIINTFFM